MSNSVDKSSNPQSLLSSQNIIYAGIAWAVLALLFFLWFSIPVPGEKGFPSWYRIGTYVFEEAALLAAAVLCFRNWRSPQIASGRNVWLGIGLGIMSFFIGDLILSWWELGWDRDPAVSPGDLFFVAFYLFIGWGMILAVLPRRLNLEIWQWITVMAIAAISIALGVWLFLAAPKATTETPAATTKPATAQISNVGVTKTPAQKAPIVQPTPKDETSEKTVPIWVDSLEKKLEPLAKPLGLFYIICDILLLIMAALLLLAFWGGRFAQSWRMIAAAAFSFYIADMWFKYATDHIENYQSGSLLEVFWVFSGVLFAIGAALEFDNSSRSRRGTRKRA